MKDYHSRIKQIRESKNLTQEYISEQLNLSQRAYSSIENGKVKLTVDKLFELSTILDVSIGDIIGSETQNIYHNNFNNNSAQNKGNLVFNQMNLDDYKILYEKIIEAKENEIKTLKEILNKNN